MKTYKASDGKEFTNKLDYCNHEGYLQALRLCWYNKRFSFKWELLYFFFRMQPKKPYNF
jgi:hypothetical protein